MVQFRLRQLMTCTRPLASGKRGDPASHPIGPMRKLLPRLLPLMLMGACTSLQGLPLGDPGPRGWKLYEAGRYAEAEPPLKQAVARAERENGPDTPQAAGQLNDLGALYSTQARYAEAEPILKRAIAINEKAFGPDNGTVAPLVINLGDVYFRQGRYAEAEGLYRRALAIR